jgi:hypothetical protein
MRSRHGIRLLAPLLEALFPSIVIRPSKPPKPSEMLQPCGFLMRAVYRPLPPEPSAKFEIVRREDVDPDAVRPTERDTSGSSGENFN